MNRYVHILPLSLPALVAIALAATASVSSADVEFDDAEFFIEINATDGDAGVQVMLDGEGWNSLEIIDPDGKTILELTADEDESIGTQGLTEFFFESAEPSFDDQTLAELLALFPEGEYEFEGLTTEGNPISGTAEFTHDIPAAPEPVVQIEDEDEVKISWDPVTFVMLGGSTFAGLWEIYQTANRVGMSNLYGITRHHLLERIREVVMFSFCLLIFVRQAIIQGAVIGHGPSLGVDYKYFTRTYEA